MARRGSLTSLIAEIERQERKRQSARRKATSKAAQAAQKAQRDYERAQVADKKERQRLHVERQIAQTELQNEDLEDQISRLTTLLAETLSTGAFDLEKVIRSMEPPTPHWDKKLEVPEKPPEIASYFPQELKGLDSILPAKRKQHAQEMAKAHERHKADMQAHANRETQRQNVLASAKVVFAERKAEHQRRLNEIDQLKHDYEAGKPSAIVEYMTIALESSNYPDDFPQHVKCAFVPESKQLVVEYDLPPFEVIPEVGTYKYNKSKDEITSTTRPATQRKALYATVVAEITLRALHELFKADRCSHIETIVLNGMVNTIDRGTGQPARPCLVTVRTTRDTFDGLDLSKVDPAACLKVLSASISKSPSELTPVRPVLEFNMVDPRFVEEADVLSTLDQRRNLMDLTPSEFESLITNLFEKMGLESRQTQASRDGGVDCVAYDPRPIFGGKVVIQAKRYKHTVGVSAVRDLFGTMQNEGASKGILVTTSGYGKASYEFANGKPLELLDGSNLLFLLAQHAGIEAKIEPPENWKDTQSDSISDEPLYDPKKNSPAAANSTNP